MATEALRCTLEFKDLRGGWSETYYLNVPSTTPPINVITALAEARADVLGSGCTIVYGRIGRTDQPRAMQKFKFILAGQAADQVGNNKGTQRRADQRDTSVLMPYRTTAGTLRYVTLGGFPDAWIDRDNTPEDIQITGAGQKSLNDFYNNLLKGPTNLLIRQRLRAGGNAAVVVSNVAEHTDGRYRVTSDLAATLVSGDKVVLTGLKGTNLANAHGVRKVVEKLDATNFTIDRGPRADLPTTELLVNALASKVGYSYEVANRTEEPYIVSTRKRGRGFSQRRGRRSASR